MNRDRQRRGVRYVINQDGLMIDGFKQNVLNLGRLRYVKNLD